jgi:hypothetical protein
LGPSRRSIGYGLIGPTEIRVILIALNTALALTPGRVHFTVAHTRFTPLDVVGIAIAAVMVVLLLVRAARNLRELAALEPAASRRGTATKP